MRLVVASLFLATNVIGSGFVAFSALLIAIVAWDTQTDAGDAFGSRFAVLGGLFFGLALAAWIATVPLWRWRLGASLLVVHAVLGLLLLAKTIQVSSGDPTAFVLVWLTLEGFGLAGLVTAKPSPEAARRRL